jgi:hypothetical protein
MGGNAGAFQRARRDVVRSSMISSKVDAGWRPTTRRKVAITGTIGSSPGSRIGIPTIGFGQSQNTYQITYVNRTERPGTHCRPLPGTRR